MAFCTDSSRTRPPRQGNEAQSPGGPDARVGRPQSASTAMPLSIASPAALGQPRIRRDADADDHEIDGDLLAIRQHRAGHPAASLGEARQPRALADVDAVRPVQRAEEIRRLGCSDAAEDSRCRLDQRHPQPARGRHRRGFQPDIAAADDQHASPLGGTRAPSGRHRPACASGRHPADRRRSLGAAAAAGRPWSAPARHRAGPRRRRAPSGPPGRWRWRARRCGARPPARHRSSRAADTTARRSSRPAGTSSTAAAR